MQFRVRACREAASLTWAVASIANIVAFVLGMVSCGKCVSVSKSVSWEGHAPCTSTTVEKKGAYLTTTPKPTVMLRAAM